MAERDLISDGSYTPTFDEITDYISEPAKDWWCGINGFIQQSYKASPKIAYSTCSAKPGWNVKYQKSGKSICTLYPEKDGFVVLVVVLLELVPIIEAMAAEFEPELVELVKRAAPFNGTKWLMIQVKREAAADNVKKLLLLKHQAVR